jgi:hypothetical protein
MNSKNLKKDLSETITLLKKFLKNNIREDGSFSMRCFYGDSFFIASLSKLREDKELQIKILGSILRKNNKDNNAHPEFDLYAFSEVASEFKEIKSKLNKKAKEIKFKKLFFKKVSNWIILRSLIRLKKKNFFGHLLAKIQLWFILKINTFNGEITDNTLRMFYRKKNNLSSQYHAFATMLLGEIAVELNSEKYKNIFLEKLELSRKEISRNGKFKMHGRGKKQIFGYASLLFSLALAHSFTKDKSYLYDFEKVFYYLRSWQKKTGEIQMVLIRKNPNKYIYSYNNLVDYEAFLLLFLIKSKEILS